MNLSGFDLNLLVAFDALMQERSVTRAAKRVGLTQPAMSNALCRLRALLDDVLLVRSGSEMVPTERALELAGPVRESLEKLSGVLLPNNFDPRKARREFHVATADLIEVAFLPVLLQRLATEAPLVDIRIYSLAGGLPSDELAAGKYDLAIGSFGDLPSEISHAALIRERFVCMVRKGHPRVGRRLSLSGSRGRASRAPSRVAPSHEEQLERQR